MEPPLLQAVPNRPTSCGVITTWQKLQIHNSTSQSECFIRVILKENIIHWFDRLSGKFDLTVLFLLPKVQTINGCYHCYRALVVG